MRIQMVLILLALSGCAKPYVKNWYENQVTVCCNNKLCGEADFQAKASEFCGENTAVLKGGSTETSGAVVTSNPNAFNPYGGYGGTAVATPIQVPCRSYVCE